MRKEICIAGFGGQGVVLGGTILGKALALYDDYEAVLTQVYGPEARGGASSANLVISDETIDYPFVQHPDVLVILSQEAYTKFRPEAAQDATILIDEGLVTPWEDDHPYGIPATRLAEEIGQRRVANVIMLGFFTAITGLVNRQAMERAIETTVKAKTVPVNLRAFAAGFEYAAQREHQG
jgi:2-oxoglutarate ferredoxin oxidoreductase subunit gamma